MAAFPIAAILSSAPSRSQTTLQPPAQGFEVASIKPNNTGQTAVSIRPGLHGRFVASNATLADLITWAYSISEDRLSGGPGWMRSTRFDINANIETQEKENTTFEMFQSRLQRLLADRFKLAVHTGTKEFPQFALVVSGAGAKLQKADPSNCTTQNTPASPGPGSPAQRPPCDFLIVRRDRMDGASVTIAKLTEALSHLLQRKVVDQTGLTGQYDVHLQWMPEELAAPSAAPSGGQSPTSPPTAPAPNAVAPPDNVAPSLFTTLQSAGLRLRSQRGPEEVVIVDHAEQPTEN